MPYKVFCLGFVEAPEWIKGPNKYFFVQSEIVVHVHRLFKGNGKTVCNSWPFKQLQGIQIYDKTLCEQKLSYLSGNLSLSH